MDLDLGPGTLDFNEVSAHITKKSVIRAWVEEHKPARAGRTELQAIRQQLARSLGSGGGVSQEYLLSVLEELGVTVDAEVRGISSELFHSLHFGTLEAAEATLRLLDERHRGARAAGDAAAVEECRRAALLVRGRAERIARGRKSDPARRAGKEEIARWFGIWLQTPDLFFDWLALRKQTGEFQRQFTTPAERG